LSCQATEHSDFASQLPIAREFLGTCGRREGLNNCVSVVGYAPFEETVTRRKWGRRSETTTAVRKQRVDCFFGFSAPGYKPDARYYTLQIIDMDSFLRAGKVVHGEWFLNKQRVAGGDHRHPLPEGFTERPESLPDFAEMTELLSILDGCRCQFMCGTEHHQIATWAASKGVVRRQCTLVAKHGKNICDGAGCIPAHALKSGIKNGAEIMPGPRGAVVFMAESHPAPTVPKEKKHDWWAFDRIFYGYYELDLFTKDAVPEAVGFSGSSKCHDFIGLSTDTSIIGNEAPLLSRDDFCFCGACRRHKFSECTYNTRHTAMRRRTTKV
jgi:hypothetical protein